MQTRTKIEISMIVFLVITFIIACASLALVLVNDSPISKTLDITQLVKNKSFATQGNVCVFDNSTEIKDSKIPMNDLIRYENATKNLDLGSYSIVSQNGQLPTLTTFTTMQSGPIVSTYVAGTLYNLITANSLKGTNIVAANSILQGTIIRISMLLQYTYVTSASPMYVFIVDSAGPSDPNRRTRVQIRLGTSTLAQSSKIQVDVDLIFRNNANPALVGQLVLSSGATITYETTTLSSRFEDTTNYADPSFDSTISQPIVLTTNIGSTGSTIQCLSACMQMLNAA